MVLTFVARPPQSATGVLPGAAQARRIPSCRTQSRPKGNNREEPSRRARDKPAAQSRRRRVADQRRPVDEQSACRQAMDSPTGRPSRNCSPVLAGPGQRRRVGGQAAGRAKTQVQTTSACPASTDPCGRRVEQAGYARCRLPTMMSSPQSRQPAEILADPHDIVRRAAQTTQGAGACQPEQGRPAGRPAPGRGAAYARVRLAAAPCAEAGGEPRAAASAAGPGSSVGSLVQIRCPHD